MESKIKFDDFVKLDLRVGKIVECTNLEKSDKLFKLKVDFGDFQRQILSGIRDYYKISDLLGKQAVFIINLPDRKIRGELSEGMILCADDGKNVIFISPKKKISNGAKVC
jgi:methionyl-tRNA synthetase